MKYKEKETNYSKGIVVDQMRDGALSIYGEIRNHIVNGKLSEDYSLPRDPITDNFYFAPGAKDGIMFGCTDPREPGDEDKAIADSILNKFREGDIRVAEEITEREFEHRSIYSIADYLPSELYRIRNEFDPDELYRAIANETAGSCKIECVKLGLIMLRIFNINNSEPMKKMVRELALCEEFTLYCVMCMLNWDNAEEEILNVAQKVEGWGRIYAVYYLPCDDKTTRDWVFSEGIYNDIGPSYISYMCYEKSGLYARLEERLSDEDFKSACVIMSGLLDEVQFNGLSIVDEREELLQRYLNQCNDRHIDIYEYNTIYDLYNYLDESDHTDLVYKKRCASILRSNECAEVVRKASLDGKGEILARALGLDCNREYLDVLRRDIKEHRHLARTLMADETYRTEVITLFEDWYRKNRKEATDNEDKSFDDDEMTVVFCVQELKWYPFEGVELLKMAASSQSKQLRSMAILVAETWMKQTGESILMGARDLQEVFLDRYLVEDDPQLHTRLGCILCNKEYKQEPIVIGKKNNTPKISTKTTPYISPDEPIFKDNGDAPDEDPTRKKSFLNTVADMYKL